MGWCSPQREVRDARSSRPRARRHSPRTATSGDEMLLLLACPGASAARIPRTSCSAARIWCARPTQDTVRGTAHDGMPIFRAVAYAAPPVGARRSMAPGPVAPWKGVRDARHPGPACPQVQEIYDTAEDGAAIQSEDCLTLNIWAPAKMAAPLPVMVFIHGGSLIEGSAARLRVRRHGTRAPWQRRRRDVAVSPRRSRRLYLGGIGGERYARSGNNGILDQVAALGWVQRNIAAFGGDPHNVTLFGESSGGASIRGLMVMPAARELLHPVIIESGDTGPVIPIAQAAQPPSDFLRLAGVRRDGNCRSCQSRRCSRRGSSCSTIQAGTRSSA